MSQVIISSLSWNRPDGTSLFKDISFIFSNERTALVGNNGSGKTTIAKIIYGEISPASGSVTKNARVGYLPQNVNLYSDFSVAEVFSIKKKLDALLRITSGKGSEEDLVLLDDDWDIENRVKSSLEKCGVEYISIDRIFSTLSGGEKIRCLLASLFVQQSSFVILDEPTNHLDFSARRIVYDFVTNWKEGMLVISHDRELLRLVDRTAELSEHGIKSYGGNYDFYYEQKQTEVDALEVKLQSAESGLKKDITEKNKTIARQEKRITIADKKAPISGMPTIMLNKKRGAGEKTLKKIKDIHEARIKQSMEKLEQAKTEYGHKRKIKIDLNDTPVRNKTIIRAEKINYAYPGGELLWKESLSFELRGAERLLLGGKNGSGKTTIMMMVRGHLRPSAGKLYVGAERIGSIDQAVSVLNDDLSLLENMKLYADKMPEHELRIRLGRFLFYKDDVFKKAGVLSGGERIRAGLACLLAGEQSPELLLLDEPTNNLDLESIQELTEALNNYKGAMLIISHDIDFVKDIGVTGEIEVINT